MNGWLIATAIVAVLTPLVFGALVWGLGNATIERRVTRLGRRAGLPLLPEIAEEVTGIEKRANRIAGLSMGGVAVVLLVVALATDDRDPFTMGILTVIISYVGLISSGFIKAVLQLRIRRSTDVRVARARAVRRSDYEPPVVSLFPAFAVLAIVGALGFSAMQPYRRMPDTSPSDLAWFPLIYVGVIVAATAIYEVIARLLIREAQFAATELELAWDDAKRVSILSEARRVPLYMGYGVASFGSLLSTSLGLFPVDYWKTMGAFFVAFAFCAVMAIVSESPWVMQRYLRRLWPRYAQAWNAFRLEEKVAKRTQRKIDDQRLREEFGGQ